MMTSSKKRKEKRGKVSSSKKENKKVQNNASEFGPLFSQDKLDLKELLESQRCNLKPKESSSRNSKLTPSLDYILSNSVALAYFMEFLETKNMKHLVDFWIAVEAFRVVAEERYNLNERNSELEKLPLTDTATDEFSQEDKYAFPKTDADSQSQKADSCEDCQKLRDVAETSMRKKFTTSQINGSEPMFQFQSQWQPFSTIDRHENHVRKKENSNHSSNYVRKIMSKKTRNRTRSSIIDAVGLYARYLSLDADEPIGIPSAIRNQIEAEICKDKKNIVPDCFKSAQNFLISELESAHQEFLHGAHGNKYRLYILQERQPTMQDIIYCDNAVFYFMEFLDRHNYKEILEFFLMADSFEQNILEKIKGGQYNINESIEDAMSIYDKYFSMRAKHQIIKDDKLRIVIENNICREDGPQPNCFCIPAAYAWTALKEVFLPDFTKSDMFQQLQESFCKSSMDDVKNDDVASSSSSGSRSESMELLSSIATSIPDCLEKDVDNLWYRPDAGRLAMGYVNQFGVFVSDKDSDEFDEKQSASSSKMSKLGKAMKNLLSKESEQDKERLAWEKARKIIEDIQQQSK